MLISEKNTVLVERRFGKVANGQLQIGLPEMFNGRQVEVVIRTLEEPRTHHRCPHPDIVGKVKIHGDILSSIPENDWNHLQ